LDLKFNWTKTRTDYDFRAMSWNASG